MAHGLEESPAESFGEALEETAASVSGSALSLAGSLPLPVTGTLYQLQQLEDFDFLMKHFYSVHTSTTAGRDLFNGPALLSHDVTLDKEGKGRRSLFTIPILRRPLRIPALRGEPLWKWEIIWQNF